MGRILAIDYGTKRLGIALSDEGQKIAFPKPFIQATKRGQILNLIENEAVEKVLIGLPKSLKGEEAKSAKEAREFAKWLKQNSHAEMELIDERFTTREAAEILKNMGQKQKVSRGLIDSLVAQRMLTRYLKTKTQKDERTRS